MMTPPECDKTADQNRQRIQEANASKIGDSHAGSCGEPPNCPMSGQCAVRQPPSTPPLLQCRRLKGFPPVAVPILSGWTNDHASISPLPLHVAIATLEL